MWLPLIVCAFMHEEACYILQQTKSPLRQHEIYMPFVYVVEDEGPKIPLVPTPVLPDPAPDMSALAGCEVEVTSDQSEQVVSLSYDLDGNLILRIGDADPNDGVVDSRDTWEYVDGLLRRQMGFSGGEVVYDVKYGFGRSGQTVNVLEDDFGDGTPDFVTTFVYDEQNRLIQEWSSDGSGSYSKTENQHDGFQRTSSLVDYGADGSIDRRRVYEWEDDRLVLYGQEVPRPVYYSYIYDDLGRVRQIDIRQSPVGEAVQGWWYRYDNRGQVVSKVERVNDAVIEQVRYYYNELGQLTREHFLIHGRVSNSYYEARCPVPVLSDDFSP